MEKVVLKATKRDVVGKQVKALRREGKLPAVIYGRHTDPININLDAHTAAVALAKVTSSSLVTIDVEGDEHLALVREKQRNYIKNTLLQDGVYLQFAWIKLGLNEVWPDATRGLLRIFSPLELESLWVGDQQNLPWKMEDLQKFIRFDHGFTNHSKTALNFLSVLSKFDD